MQDNRAEEPPKPNTKNGKDITRSHKITFAKSPPMGTRGTFTHDGELWIAYPASKNQRISTALDRMVGALYGITKEMIRWINERPDDAELVARVLDIASRARTLHQELTIEKQEAMTS